MVLSLDAQDAVIKNRLAVDERPLKKVVKAVCRITRLSEVQDLEEETQAVALDFSNYDNTLRRIIALLKANTREVERYELERVKTGETYSQAAAEIQRLQVELVQEKKDRDDRATYDMIADDIQRTAEKSRKQQSLAIAKLEEEVAELEREKGQYNAVWQTRKAGFDDIMTKLEVLRREISGEKESAELRGMDSDEEEGAITDAVVPGADTTEAVETEETKAAQEVVEEDVTKDSTMMDVS